MTRIILKEGDLTDEDVDAIVNAANSELVLGSGVAGAIDTRGGPAVAEECAAQGPIKVGEVAVTGAGRLSAQWVIHAAGMAPGGRVTETALQDVLRATFVAAEEKGCRTIALPAIGSGVGGLSLQRCAEISIEAARHYAENGTGISGTEAAASKGSNRVEEIRFVLFGEPAFRLFEMVNDAAKVEAQMRKLRER